MEIVRAVMAGCLILTIPPSEARSDRIETIRYDQSGCLGSCKNFVVTVFSDGRGVFVGRGYTAVRGEQAFTVTSAQFNAFHKNLQSIRPAGEKLIRQGTRLCLLHTSETIGFDVQWRVTGRRDGHLFYDIACESDGYTKLQAILIAAPKALPIANLVGAE